MHKQYLPKTPEGKLSHLVEECAEVTKAVMKIQRFGLEGHYDDGVPNMQKLREELKDLEFTINAVHLVFFGPKRRKK